MGYYIDLETISIDQYKKKLESAYLPPSRMILRDELDKRFTYFKSIGIQNVSELLQILKKKEKLEEIAQVNFFSVEYLKILLRELNSTLPKPNRLVDFTGISTSVLLKLEKAGIKNTRNLFDRVKNVKGRKELSESLNIDEPDILELTKLTDLSRIKWVGATFARMLYMLGIDTVEKASRSDPIELHKKINALNKKDGFYKGQIGLNDTRIFIQAAKEVPLEIEYK